MREMGRWLCVSGVLAAGLGAWLVGCAGAEEEADGDGPRVVASIQPLGSLAGQIVGSTGRVEVLLPPGRSPHGFELTANQVRRLAAADVVLVAGGGVDPWAAQAAEQSARAVTLIDMHQWTVERFDLDASAHAHEHQHHHEHHGHDHDHGHDHGAINPHHWLDPVRVRAFVEHVGEQIAAQHPTHAKAIRDNTDTLMAAVDEVDAAHRAALADVRRTELITFHNAFDPLAERYGLRVIAHLTPIELTPGGEITPRRLRAAVDAIERYDLPVIYVEPQFPERAVEALRDQTNTAMLRLDPLGHPRRAGYETWQATMRSNLHTLVDGQNR